MSHSDNTSAIAAAELETLIREGVPLVGSYGVTVESVGAGTIRLPCSGWPTWRCTARS